MVLVMILGVVSMPYVFMLWDGIAGQCASAVIVCSSLYNMSSVYNHVAFSIPHFS
jgi:hypothetical protein